VAINGADTIRLGKVIEVPSKLVSVHGAHLGTCDPNRPFPNHHMG